MGRFARSERGPAVDQLALHCCLVRALTLSLSLSPFAKIDQRRGCRWMRMFGEGGVLLSQSWADYPHELRRCGRASRIQWAIPRSLFPFSPSLFPFSVCYFAFSSKLAIRVHKGTELMLVLL